LNSLVRCFSYWRHTITIRIAAMNGMIMLTTMLPPQR